MQYPETATGDGQVAFSISGIGQALDRPIRTHYTFRYRGLGVDTITFHLRSEDWTQQNVEYKPLHAPTEKVDVKEWKTVVGDRVYSYATGKPEYPEYPSDIDTISVGLKMLPGADVVIELDEIRVVGK